MVSLDPPEVTTVHMAVHASVGWGLNVSCVLRSDPPSSRNWVNGIPETAYSDIVINNSFQTVDGSLWYSLSFVP